MKYSIGLDIGIASVGWAIINLDKQRIEDLGVRIFDKAEHPKDGKSLATPRREARSARRRNRRKSHRIERIKNLIVNSKILTRDEIINLYNKPFDIDVWDLRVQALERKLTDEELARVLIHIAQRRGFKSNRKSQTNDDETGKLLKSVNENKRILIEKNYKTIAEMFVKYDKFKNHKRNKSESYLNTVSRELLEEEIKIIFKVQKDLNNEKISKELEDKYIEIFLSQRPFANKDQIEKLIGYCTFEKEAKEKRTPKATYSFQKFMALQKINNLRLIKDDETLELSQDQRNKILVLCFTKDIVKYKDIRKALLFEEGTKFKNLYYPKDKPISKVEDIKIVEMKEYHQIRKVLDKNYEKGYITKLTADELDNIGYLLTVCKTDIELNNELLNYGFDDKLAQVLKQLSFTKVGHLSLKAIKKILPYLEKGYTYDKACEAANYTFNGIKKEKQYLLPPIEEGEVANPVVNRALSQSRKVINAIIRKYGSPTYINIETARELSKTFKERDDIEKNQKNNRSKNEKARKNIEQTLGIINPRGIDIVKYKLWEEQLGYCLYSGKYIEPERIFEDGYTDVDHIIPYSRSIDDSYNNKVLVLASENRQKGNETPYEYFGENINKWTEFEARVESNKSINSRKKKNLLNKDYDKRDENEFIDRNLNDTRYITRYLYNFIKDNLVFEESKDKKKVHAINGPITSYIRARLGFNKNREESDLHHALDAVIVAITTEKMVKNITDYTKVRELEYSKINGKFIDRESGELLNKKEYDRKYGVMFPEPWENFRKEVEVRMSENPGELLKNLRLSNYNDVDLDNLKPIFASRMPRRKITGAAHEAKIRANKGRDVDGKYITVVKTKLEEIKFDKYGNFDMYDKESSIYLYNAIKERYLSSGRNAKKAFSIPLYKPTKEGKVAPEVKSVKIYKRQTMINKINGGKGVVDNGKIIRTDVFFKDNKYYLIPIYTIDTTKGELPNRAITDKKGYEEWTIIDNSFDFKFSLYPNDLIRVVHKKAIKAKDKQGNKVELKELLGYYRGVNSSNASITMISNDNKIEAKGVGSKTLIVFEKYSVDILGNYNKIEEEDREEFNS